MNLEKEKYKELFQQHPREFVECLYHAKGMKTPQAKSQRRYAAKKKETEIPQNAANHKEENVQRQKRYQAKMREKQQTDSVCEIENRRAKHLERLHKCTARKKKIETPPECTVQNISPPKGDTK